MAQPIYAVCVNRRAYRTLDALSRSVLATSSAFGRSTACGDKIRKCLGAKFYYFLVTSESKDPHSREFHIHISIGFSSFIPFNHLLNKYLLCTCFVLGTQRVTANRVKFLRSLGAMWHSILKRCSISLIIRKMHIKTRKRYHLTHSEWLLSKNSINSMCW